MKTSKYFGFIILLCIVLSLSAWHTHGKLKAREGYLQVDGGKVWYRIVGEGHKTPILILHGGPGAPSYYLKPLSALAKDRSVIFFDQLGCGKSDKLTDTTLMNVPHYVDELGQVIQKLGLKEVYLYGHSWGTMLATEYYLQHPRGIKALILNSPCLSIPLWLKDSDTLIASLPDSIQRTIRTHEQMGTTDSPGYQQAVEVYYQNFLARKMPWSVDLDSTFQQFGNEVYNYMQGPSEFTITGVIKNYDRTGQLSKIKVPTLFIAGEFDEVRPQTMKYYQSLIPNSKLEFIKNSGHLTTQDNPEDTNAVIMQFIKEIENKTIAQNKK
jgi:proline iminopeptidase